MRVLLVEDDQELARLVRGALAAAHIGVDVAADGDAGLELALQGMYDVAIVDWMLPGRDGPSLCRAIRAARRPLAILMLTARDTVEERVAGLRSGADDYLGKPFAVEELLARVEALGRRVNPLTGDPGELRHGELVLDRRARTARYGLHPLQLTATEWEFVECFLRHPGQALTRSQLLDYSRTDKDDVQLGMVDVYISYLRRKLAAAGAPDLIETVRGVGYRLAARVEHGPALPSIDGQSSQARPGAGGAV